MVEVPQGTTDPIFQEPPLESRGVIIYEITKINEDSETTNKVIIIPPFTQQEIDSLAFARSNRELLDGLETQTYLAHVIYADTNIPWGMGLLKRGNVINQINTVINRLDKTLSTRLRDPYNKTNYSPVFGIVGYIRSALTRFKTGDKTLNPAA